MKRLLVAVAMLAGVMAGTAWGQDAATPTLKLEGKLPSSQTGVADQTDVAVTVYNNDRALVRDRRKISLETGELTLKFMDVAEKIQPETVSLVSLNDAGNLHILEQNYEYDLMSPEKLLEKYVGKDVTLVNKSKEVDFLEQKAKLLSVNNGAVYEVEGKIYLGHPGLVVLPELPQELISKPSLIWTLANSGKDHEVEATYLTSGMSWKADYVLTMNKEETQMNIDGWVTLNNQSGAPYNNAQLKLVAGEVNIVPQAPPAVGGAMAKRAMRMEMAPAPMQEEAFAEYHLYTLPRRTTIKQNQSKQVSLLSGTQIGVKKIYEFRGDVAYYSSKIDPIKDQNVDVFLTFENREKNQLGMPLPAGIMRIYQKDSSDMYQFSGEDRIKHTAKDETVRLRMGKAFDVVADRIQSDYRVLSSTSHESAYKITVRNHKEVPITVDVVEPMPGMWSIIEKSADFVKKDASTAVFSLPMKAEETVELTYRVRVQY